MGKILCIDFDDVIVRTLEVIDPIIQKIKYEASEKYVKDIKLMYLKRGEIELFNELMNKHFDFKDRVLEEIDDEFKARIDYREIFTLENTYPYVIEYINYLTKSGVFDKVYIVSHFNSNREIDAKYEFIKKYLDSNIEFYPLKFHDIPYGSTNNLNQVVQRARTSKYDFIKEKLNISKNDSLYLVDDSKGNGDDWKKKGGEFFHYNVKNDEFKVGSIKSLMPFEVFCQMQMLASTKMLNSGQDESKKIR